MVPFSIRQLGAALNFSLAVGFLLSNYQTGIYISMQGMIELHQKVFKNRKIGVFQRINQ
jgi:L-asparaginase